MCCRELKMNLDFQDQKKIAEILARISYFLHPDIISKIQDCNRESKEEFEKILKKSIHDEEVVGRLMDKYLFDGSDCVFPFTRRHIGDEGHINGRYDRLKYYTREWAIIDDNEFPRHIWTFLLIDRCFNGERWISSGASNFELAHVFNHKRNGDTTAMDEFFCEPHEDFHKTQYLFTSAANVVMIPKGMAKPTDGLGLVQKMFFQRMMDLYGNSILKSKPEYSLSDEELKLYQNLEWKVPFRPDDWSRKIDDLNKYRIRRIECIMTKHMIENGCADLNLE